MYLGEIAAIITAISWALGSIVFTKASKEVGSIQMNMDRLSLAFLLISITILIAGIKFNISQTQFIYLFISGLFGLVIGDTFLFRSLPMIGPRVAFMVMALSPIFSTVFSLFIFHENISYKQLGGIVITIVGVISVVIFRNLSRKAQYETFDYSLKGFAFALIASLGQALGLLFAKLAYLEGNMDSFLATDVRLLSALIVLLPLSLLLKKYQFPNKFYQNKQHLIKFTVLGAILGPYIGITLSFFAIKHSSLGVASTLLATTPIMVIPFSIIFLKERLNFISIFGALLAVGGIALIFYK